VFTASALNENAIGTSAGTFGTLTNAVKDSGQDVGAVINGIAATSNGSTARINSDFLDLELNLTTSGTQTLGAFTALTVTGGGAKFNLGPNVDLTNQVSVGIENVAARNLGNVSDGFLDDLGAGKSSNVVDGDVETAQTIVNSAIGKVSSLRGRLGAVQKNVIGATIRSLGVALENTSAAESAIRDTDFAAETAELTRRQILVQAASQTLSISNAQPSNVLGLLR
jgi:flagellin